MRAILILFVWMLTVPCLQASVVNDSLLTRMDKVLADRGKISSMKNVRIKALTDYVKKVKDPRNLLQIYESLFQEYEVYQFDSALVYIEKAQECALRIGSKEKASHCMVQKASLLSTVGFYSEAQVLLSIQWSCSVTMQRSFIITSRISSSTPISVITTAMTSFHGNARRRRGNVSSRPSNILPKISRDMIIILENTMSMWSQTTRKPCIIISRR